MAEKLNVNNIELTTVARQEVSNGKYKREILKY